MQITKLIQVNSSIKTFNIYYTSPIASLIKKAQNLNYNLQ